MKLVLEIQRGELSKLVGCILDAAELARRSENYAYVEMSPDNTLDIYQRNTSHPIAKDLDSLQYRLAGLQPHGQGYVELAFTDAVPWTLRELVRLAIRKHPRKIASQIRWDVL